MNDVMAETIPVTETGAQDTSDAMTEMIPSVGETVRQDAALAESAEIIWTGPHPAIAESAEIIWSPAIAATADSGPTAGIAQAAVTAQIPATMVEATGTAQFVVTGPAARRARGRHAAPRSAGTRPSAAGLAKRGGGRHAATRPAGGVGRRFAMSMSPAAMVAAGPSVVTG